MQPDKHLVGEFFSVFGRVLWRTKAIYGVLFILICLGGFIVGRVENLGWGDGFYFAMVTGLTIGYGDIVLHSPVGRLVAILIGLVGILFSGLLVAVLVYAIRESFEESEKRG